MHVFLDYSVIFISDYNIDFYPLCAALATRRADAPCGFDSLALLVFYPLHALQRLSLAADKVTL